MLLLQGLRFEALLSSRPYMLLPQGLRFQALLSLRPYSARGPTMEEALAPKRREMATPLYGLCNGHLHVLYIHVLYMVTW